MLPRHVFWYEIGFLGGCKIDRKLNQTAVQTKKAKNDAVEIEVFTNDIWPRSSGEEILWQRLGVDHLAKPHEMEPQELGWDNVAKKKPLMVHDTNVSIHPGYAQMIMEFDKIRDSGLSSHERLVIDPA